MRRSMQAATVQLAAGPADAKATRDTEASGQSELIR
ncbi:protein of unknown function [Paraburkholderia dioscoreae]|uniref:Uncharacterized protein n=1 Tax=Paraburkholderia dioscoreae TaxID=2604047 RepID=A0A5Q4YSQ5_9BURK|nr:protein of unknown function [Paraburkholderia dioscoreae]